MIGSNFIYFIRQSVINTVMGRVLGTSSLGIFSMASLFSDLPNRIISGPLQAVLYPRLFRLKDEKNNIRILYLFISRILSIIVVPTMGMIGVAHEPIFTIILPEKWQQAGHIFMILAPAGIIQFITALHGPVLMAVGKTDIILRQSVIYSFIMLLLFITFVQFGLEWAAISISISSFIVIPIFLYQLFPIINLTFKEYIKAVMTPMVLTILAVIIYLGG